MSQNQTKKKGFTLIETVTTVGIIAVLAAVVVPTVAQQYNNADPTRFAQDMADLRTAIQTFNIDVKGKYPGDLEDLSFRITSTTDSSLQADTTGFGNTFVKVFSSSDNSAWNGPYIDFPFVDNGSKSTAYNANISDQLYPFSATDSLFGYETGATSPSPSWTASVGMFISSAASWPTRCRS